MPTPVFVCGAECGLAATGTAGVGVEHWSAATGTAATVSTTTYNDAGGSGGLRALRFNPSAATSYLTHTFTTAVASPATVVGRFSVYFATLPSGDTFLLRDAGATTTGVYFSQSDSKIYARAVGSNSSTGIAVTTGRWYLIDFKYVKNTTTTCDVQVRGTATTQASAAGSAATSTGFDVGVITSTTADVFIDDIIVSGTSGDYPIGPGVVAGIYPDSDGTHVYNAATDFGKAGDANTNLATPSSSETTSWQSLTKPLSTSIDTTKYVRDALGASTEYLQWGFENLPTNAPATLNGLMVVTTNHAAGTPSCTVTGRLNDNGTTNDVYNLADFSENTIVTAVKTYATAPSTSAAWTKTLVNGLKFEWGLAGDVNPDPILDGVMFEVDYPLPLLVTSSGTGVSYNDTAKVNASIQNSSGTGSGQSATPGLGPNAGLTSSTGAAYDATTVCTTNAAAQLASGTGTAPDATSNIGPNAGLTSGTGTAYGVTPNVGPNAGLTSSVGAAYDATCTTSASAELASGTGTADNATSNVALNAELASGTGIADDATVVTGGSTNAPAEVASATGTAYDSTTSVAASAEIAQATGTSYDAVTSVLVNAELASGTGSSFNTTSSIAVTSESSGVTGTAWNGSWTNAPAGTALGSVSIDSTSSGVLVGAIRA